jgi:hypothetical protein
MHGMNISHDAVPHVAALVRAAFRLLEEIDQGRMLDIWERASESARRLVPPQEVADAIGPFREGQGALVSRHWVGARRDPAAPQYLRLTFESAFAAWAGEEMVTLEQEADGIWRLAGYAVLPAEAAAA